MEAADPGEGSGWGGGWHLKKKGLAVDFLNGWIVICLCNPYLGGEIKIV